MNTLKSIHNLSKTIQVAKRLNSQKIKHNKDFLCFWGDNATVKSCVRVCAKQHLLTMVHNHSVKAMWTKAQLRRAALNGNFYSLPGWVQDKV